MQIDLKNKVVIITGSSKGIGKNLIASFSMEGASLVINYNSSKEEAYELYNSINKITDCLICKADITDIKQVQDFAEATYRKFGKIHVLINNAGIINDADILYMNDQQWSNVINTNLSGTFYCCREFLKYMIPEKCGKIINIGSIIGKQGRTGQINYSASKSALVGFTKSLAKEIAPYNIAVNMVCPGFISTDLNKNYPKKKRSAEEQSLLPISHSYEDLKNFLLLLASDSIQGVSGRIFYLDSRII